MHLYVFIAILVPKLVAIVTPLCPLCTGVSQTNSQIAQTPVVKLSRNAAERRSDTFLKAGTAYRDFYTGERRNATHENGTYFSRVFRQMAVIVNHHAPAER